MAFGKSDPALIAESTYPFGDKKNSRYIGRGDTNYTVNIDRKTHA